MRRLIARGRGADAEESPEFWVAYSDLLVSLLMVFALLLFLALSKIQQEIQGAKAVSESISAVIERAQSALAGTGAAVRLDSAKKAITFDSEVLFSFGSAQLQPRSAAAIGNVARMLPEVLSDPKAGGMIDAIVIEGHTDTVGTYLANLQLSQSRAQSVMQAIVLASAASQDTAYIRRLQTLLVASGRSEVEPVSDSTGAISGPLSRRIEIRFRTRDDLLLGRIFEELAGTGKR